MTKKEKTALNVSVGADTEQPSHKSLKYYNSKR